MTAPLRHGWTAALHQPFLELRADGEVCLAARAPLIAAELPAGEEGRPTMQRVLSSNFRANLLRQVNVPGHALRRPQETAPGLRSAPWSDLCDRLDRAEADRANLASPDGLRLLHLCLLLGFHRYTVELATPAAAGDLANESVAATAYLRSFAQRMLQADHLGPSSADDLRELVARAPESSRVRFYAASALLVHLAKTNRDLTEMAHVRRTMEGYERSMLKHPESWSRILDLSRHYRAASYIPFLSGDVVAAADELAQAEQLARQALAQSRRGSSEHWISLDNLHAVLETRMREALALNDLDMALTKISEVLEFDPLDSKAHIEAGQIHLRLRHHAAAGQCFARAARYGPPGTAVALYLLGHCREAQEDREGALDAYLAALRVDPFGVSAADGVRRVADRLGNPSACAWGDKRRDHLTRVGADR